MDHCLGESADLRLCVSGAAALPVELMHAFEAKYNVTILEGYGLSETSPVASSNVRQRPRKPGSIGLPIWGIEMKIFDDDDDELPPGPDNMGEIVIRGHNVMKGYYKRPEETAHAFRNGCIHTGDVARVDEENYYYIVDRIKDMVIRDGLNVYPREVEEVLMMHPVVSLAAVIGVPDEKSGEAIKVFLVKSADSTLTEKDVIAHMRSSLTAYKVPKHVEFRDALPTTNVGKILRRELRDEELKKLASQ